MKDNPSDMYLKLGVYYDDVFKSGFLVNYMIKYLLFKNSIFLADFVLKYNLRRAFNYYIYNGWKLSYGYHLILNQFTTTPLPPVRCDELDNGNIKIDFNYWELMQ